MKPKPATSWTTAGLDLLSLGWGHAFPGDYPVPVTSSDGWIYLLVQRGPLGLVLAKEERPLHPGDLLVISDGFARGWSGRKGVPCRAPSWRWRSPPRLSQLAPPKGQFLHFKAPPALQQFLLQVHKECRKEVKNLSALSPFVFEKCRIELELAIVRSFATTACRAGPAQRLGLALEWLREHVNVPDPVARVSEHLGLSPSTVNRLFLRCLHQSPSAYVHAERMRLAREWLQRGELSVKQIAYALGYRHPNDFSRAFKNSFNLNPRSCRNR